MAHRREQPLYAPLGREHRVLLEAVRSRYVVRDQLERKIEAAGPNELDQRLHAGSDDRLLPASDDRAVATGALGELSLSETGSKPCFPDQARASHRAEFTTRLDLVLLGIYASRSRDE